MKISEADIVIVPGYTNSDEDHWQSRWEAKIKTARRLQQDDWHKPVVEDWTAKLAHAVDEATRPVVLVAHSLGCHVVVQTVAQIAPDQLKKIKGAFLVSPPDVENPNMKPRHLMTFGPYPRDPLAFPSVVVASVNDEFCEQTVAEDMAASWGSRFVNARESGHINGKSGHGPWPDGLLVFADFMKNLKV